MGVALASTHPTASVQTRCAPHHVGVPGTPLLQTVYIHISVICCSCSINRHRCPTPMSLLHQAVQCNLFRNWYPQRPHAPRPTPHAPPRQAKRKAESVDMLAFLCITQQRWVGGWTPDTQRCEDVKRGCGRRLYAAGKSAPGRWWSHVLPLLCWQLHDLHEHPDPRLHRHPLAQRQKETGKSLYSRAHPA